MGDDKTEVREASIKYGSAEKAKRNVKEFLLETKISLLDKEIDEDSTSPTISG